MKRTILITLTLLLGLAQGAWAETYTYYIVERDPNTNTLYFKGTNIEPENNNNSHRYSIDYKYNGAPIWSLGEGTVWPTVTKIVFEPSFAGARPTSISRWFANKPNLTSIVGMNEYLNTSDVTSMSSLFWGCNSLTMLDLSSFNTAKVTEMHYMFKNCSNLKTIVVGDGWTTSNVSINWNHGMFEGCTSLVGQDGTTLSSTVDISKAHYGAGGYLTSEVYYWSNSNNIPSAFYDVSNSGTTITIHNMGDMKLLAQNVNNGNNYSGYTFLLARDLALDPSVENNFTTIGNSNTHYFAGTFDGQGHTISGININAEGRQGLFGSVSGGTIKNLTLSNSTIISISTSKVSAGGIVGVSGNGVTIENCHVTKDVTIISGNNSGGIIGSTDKGDVNITGCTSAATVTSQSGVGGIIGKCGNESSSNTTAVTITDCLYYGESLTGSSSNAIVGGIVGFYCTHKTNNNELISQVTLRNNYYSTGLAASIKGIGQKKNITGDTSNTTSNCDLIDDNGAIRVHVVTDADIADMGTAGTPYANGITPYTYGIAYDGEYYSHVLALDNNRDCTGLLDEYNGMTFNVKLRGRTLYKNGSWNTICLPFAYSGGIFTGDCELRELNTTGLYYVGSDSESGTHYKTGVQDDKLYLFFKTTNPRDKIEAGTPYIVKWTRVNDYNENDPSYDYAEPIFNNVTIDATGPSSVTSSDEAVTFTPTYKPIYIDYIEPSILYIGADNYLYYPQGNGTTKINSFRAYFKLKNGFHMAEPVSGDDEDEPFFEGGGDARVIIINIDNETEGISTLTSHCSPLTADWYTLDGRKLKGQPSIPGVYVNNKRKVIIK